MSEIRASKQTNEQLAWHVSNMRKSGFHKVADDYQELLDRRVAMGYDPPPPPVDPEIEAESARRRAVASQVRQELAASRKRGEQS